MAALDQDILSEDTTLRRPEPRGTGRGGGERSGGKGQASSAGETREAGGRAGRLQDYSGCDGRSLNGCKQTSVPILIGKGGGRLVKRLLAKGWRGCPGGGDRRGGRKRGQTEAGLARGLGGRLSEGGSQMLRFGAGTLGAT